MIRVQQVVCRGAGEKDDDAMKRATKEACKDWEDKEVSVDLARWRQLRSLARRAKRDR